ncbi:dienelactone hydrolase family protein [Devosia sp. SL43]|uniref:dienelactone hydrolase family protein n=1 Tax=Devosia sp. SL43 TaxID=2806348 RepID=UPI001F453489|nr:dienelactone hydrolase family protein [Devosia sp. SL43]UJW85589.1 dienelactone hydrolase family protein [Devosia sp. SL43]
MGERVKITASDGFSLNAYRAVPEGPVRGGVVVIQEVWGLNTFIRDVVDRYARHGFVAVAPAMFDRIEYGYESDNYGPEQFVIIGELMKKFDHATALLDVAAAIEPAKAGGKVGITGYCFGGAVSWRAANKGLGLSAASGYYGGGIPNYIELEPSIPLEMHYGDQDTGIPLEQVEALKARHPGVAIHLYEAAHGFCNNQRASNFNEAACTKASARTLDFFRKHLG